MTPLIVAALLLATLTGLAALAWRDLRRPACHWCGYPCAPGARQCPSCGARFG